MSTTQDNNNNDGPSNDDIAELFKRYFNTYGKEQVGKLAGSYPRDTRSVYVDLEDLSKVNTDGIDSLDSGDITQKLTDHPDTVINAAEDSLSQLDLPIQPSDDFDRAHVRFHNLLDPDFIPIRHLRAEHANNFLGISGTVRQKTQVKPKLEEAAFECQRCGLTTRVDQSGPETQEPYECGGCERQGPFKVDFNKSEFIDAQLLKVQEQHDSLRGTETPQDIRVDIEDDICGEVTAGDSITVSGVLRMEEPTGDNAGRYFDLYIEGNNIIREEKDFEDLEMTEEDIETIQQIATEPETYDSEYTGKDATYNMAVDSVAPSIYGYDTEKLGILLQLFGGVPKTLPDGSTIRGDFHMLLIGDPGTGKSAMIQYIENIAPRSVYASGKGSSTAGLTAAAVRDDLGDGSQWTLEAGAMVLADKGIAAIDELDKMRPEDRSALHEGLEQQKITVSKAGINATLQTRCALLAAANPIHGRFDEYEPMAEQIDLEPALISRFDLIFTITDNPDEKEDRTLAQHILESNRAGELFTHKSEVTQESSWADVELGDDAETVTPPIEPELFQKYIAYAKSNVFPVLTEEAHEHLEDFYVDLRLSGDDDDAIPVTARKLEGLVRLAEASARVRLSDTATIEDAKRATDIVMSSLEDVGIDPETGEFDADVIETGTSTTQQKRIKDVKNIIESLQDNEEYDDGVPIEAVLETFEESGDVDVSKIEHQIEKLKQQGDLYEPSGGHVRTT